MNSTDAKFDRQALEIIFKCPLTCLCGQNGRIDKLYLRIITFEFHSALEHRYSKEWSKNILDMIEPKKEKFIIRFVFLRKHSLSHIEKRD